MDIINSTVFRVLRLHGLHVFATLEMCPKFFNVHGDGLDEVIGVAWTTHVLQVLNEDVRCPELDEKTRRKDISGNLCSPHLRRWARG